jgi:SRSO17 transposase
VWNRAPLVAKDDDPERGERLVQMRFPAEQLHAREVEGGHIRAMQRLLSEVVWDEDHMRWTYHPLVNDDLGEPEGVLMFEESGFPKKGQDSVGVGRQSCGTLGKVANCQVGVCAASASCPGYALLDKRLFLPAGWLTAAYATRRTKCQGPPEATFQTQPQLAAQMMRTLRDEGLLPGKYVVADCLYGNSPECLEAVARSVALVYVVAISADTRGWLQGPGMERTQYRYRGEVRPKRPGAAKDSAPPSVEAMAKSMPGGCWCRRTVSEGTKGPIAYAFTKRRMTLGRDGLPARAVWLVITRPLGAEPTYWYSISNAPLRTRLPLFVWLSGVRWAVEQGFEAAKTALGMDHDEIRKYPGWHHHMLTGMVAHCFLWHLKLRLGKKSSSTHGGTSAEVTGSGLALAHLSD